MPRYPDPDCNPHCQCQGDYAKQHACGFGHPIECHFPYTCEEAGCLDLLTQPTITSRRFCDLENLAVARLKAGDLAPYRAHPVSFEGGVAAIAAALRVDAEHDKTPRGPSNGDPGTSRRAEK
jgi:hypothetical protein